jgi:hypothetical protein
MDEIRSVGVDAFSRLSKNIKGTNVTILSPQGKTKQCESPQEIVADFFDVRLQFYQERKSAVLEDRRDVSVRLLDQTWFMKQFIENNLEGQNVHEWRFGGLEPAWIWPLRVNEEAPETRIEDKLAIENGDDEDREGTKKTDIMMASFHRVYACLLAGSEAMCFET